MKARVSQLYKTEAEWSKLPDFKPLAGEIIIFAPDEQHRSARLKIGDGTSLLKNLPFFVSVDTEKPTTNKVIDAGRITNDK